MTLPSSSSSIATTTTASGGAFSPFALLSDDIVLNILAKLETDPRDWARLACVSSRLSSLVRTVCCRSRCYRSLPSDLLPSTAASAAWPSLHKLCVCCPGLLRAGVLLEHSDFGLERDIGPHRSVPFCSSSCPPIPPSQIHPVTTDSCWSLFDDLYFDTIYEHSEFQDAVLPPIDSSPSETAVRGGSAATRKRKKHRVGPAGAHLASGPWTVSREQGSKLLASRFRGDCLYMCDWPGCVHAEEKRKYMLFRGVFKNFKRSRVWKTISDSNRGKIALGCAFCACRETWDLRSAFCLRRVFGFHDDGEPVVRAYSGSADIHWLESRALLENKHRSHCSILMFLSFRIPSEIHHQCGKSLTNMLLHGVLTITSSLAMLFGRESYMQSFLLSLATMECATKSLLLEQQIISNLQHRNSSSISTHLRWWVASLANAGGGAIKTILL
ncbi:Phytochrome A-associated F-box [Musa troglodytarum]|uniref:Phytochrome A-associated F-box n=1 Tax=Musa troglodytarum TaxID=320322 RepID=A0A9E7HEC2_9LILI|nr:Phytochrome A-associated F-box [Musa troglodytarum]